jgi:predicted component of type VI protein secretion system
VKANLIVLTPGKQQGKSIQLGHDLFVIGRDAACQLRPQSSQVSARHCSLVVRDEQLFIRDLNSTNGTFVDGKRLHHEQRLKGGERVQVGTLVFGVSIVRSLSGGEATALPSRPSPQETVEEAASVLLSTTNDQEPLSHNVEHVPDDPVASDAATPAQLSDEAIDENAAAILLSMANDQEPAHDRLEPFTDDLVESDLATPAQMLEEEDAASILLSMPEDQVPPDNGLEPSADDPDEIDAATPAQMYEAMRLLKWRGFL